VARFVVGDVVIVPFPFSDLSESKRRPALVLAVLTGDDLILCQITSQSVRVIRIDRAFLILSVRIIDRSFCYSGQGH
jgi:hypothetical protein